MEYELHRTVYMEKTAPSLIPLRLLQMNNALHPGLFREDVEPPRVDWVKKVIEETFLPSFSQRTLILTMCHRPECLVEVNREVQAQFW